MLFINLLSLGCTTDPDKPNTDAVWEFATIYGVPNVDDDNEDGIPDAESDLNSSEDDLEVLELDAAFWNGGELTLTQNDDGVRVYENGDLIMNTAGDSRSLTTDAFIEIEFLEYNATGSLTLSQGNNSVDISLQSAPLIINHHLQPAEMVYAMSYNGGGGNGTFINGLSTALGERFTPFDLQTYGWDVWIQDEIEFGTLVSPSTRIDVIIDSIRDRGLDDLPEMELEGNGYAVQVWGEGWATSQDSFGNLEATPPITVDGTEYPFGRIYYGNWRSDSIHPDLKLFLQEQSVQRPLELDVTWLCVGHVDEFMTFIPDPSSEKGFKLMVTDTEVGYQFFENLELETAYCSDESLPDQISCEETGECSDSSFTSQEDCASAGQCSDVSITDKANCEISGYCSDNSIVTQDECETSGVCSNPAMSDQAGCEAQGECSEPLHDSFTDCEANGGTWTDGSWTSNVWTAETWTAETWTTEVWTSLSLPKYSSDHNYDDVSQILNDVALRALNEDIQTDYIEPNIETMIEEFALTEDDIIRVPMLFEEAAGCGSYTATLLPGTVNMIVAPDPDNNETDLIMPDPFFRQTLNNQSNDPFIAHVESLLPEGSRPHWVDDWEWYHMALGEVHCGSNTKRTPTSNWYDSAQHLLGGE